MLVIEGLNFNLIGQEPLKVEHFFSFEWHITEGEKLFKVQRGVKDICTCGENDCRHIEAVKTTVKEQAKKNETKIPMSPDRMREPFRTKAWEARWKECQRQAEIERQQSQQCHNGVFLDPEIEF